MCDKRTVKAYLTPQNRCVILRRHRKSAHISEAKQIVRVRKHIPVLSIREKVTHVLHIEINVSAVIFSVRAGI